MKKTITLVTIFVICLLAWTAKAQTKFEKGKTYHGFKLIEQRFVKEINTNCLYFIHEKSGARLLKVAENDANKLFGISFRTTPETDYGTPHILEHSVLNGSTNFPVKSPFDVLIKGSLNTFLNAMTSSDYTTYPVASMNDKDYFNLMHVYLDAVFNPVLHTDPRILKQEGWHYELDNIEGDIVYKGVVYNEMKGAFSSPGRELSYQVYKILFPDNTYGVSSGGYPAAIPGLTNEYFTAFHKKYYHPENSYIILYGNADLNKELTFINEEYLSKYEKTGEKIEIPLQKPFEAKKYAEKPYAVAEGSSTTNNTFLNLSIVTGKNSDQELVMALNILREALVNHESAPIRIALQEAKIGKDVRASVNDILQNVFQITVQNANAEDRDKFDQIVYSTMQKVAEQGFDKKMIEGIINRMEFGLRENNSSQKGMIYLMKTQKTVFFDNDPFKGLEFETVLANVKKGVENGLLEKIIKENLLSNPHTLLMVLKPQPGLEKEIAAQSAKELAEYKASLSKEQLEKLVEETKALKAYQEEGDSPEALASIPMLEIKDISPDVEYFTVKEKKVANVPVLHYEDFTNDILYSTMYFDLRVLPQDLIPYASLLSELLGSLNTKTYSFGDLDNELNIHTGGFNTYISSYLENYNDDLLQPKFVISSKATVGKSNKLFDLTSEILRNSNLNDAERVKDVLTRYQARIESSVKNNGSMYAINRLQSYFSKQGMYNELTNGLEYYRFITDLTKNFETKQKEISDNLNKVVELLMTKENLIAAITCSKENYAIYTKDLNSFVSSLGSGKPQYQSWNFNYELKNEGLMAASKVQYVIKGYDYKKLGYQYTGKIRVLNQVLSRDYLHNKIRVMGGAYGGSSRFSTSGIAYFQSYRDPNLKETFENFDGAPEFVKSFNPNNTEMTRFIIGTISDLDQPTTASQRGSIGVYNYFTKTTYEQLKAERNAILTTTPEDIRAMEKMVKDILSQNAICVYGGQEKIKANSDLFKTTINVTE